MSKTENPTTGWVRMNAKVTRISRVNYEVVLDYQRLKTLLWANGVELPPDATAVVRGIPQQIDWDLDSDGEEGVHVLLRWTTEKTVEGDA